MTNEPNEPGWSREAWRRAAHVYENILRHPFVTELASGKLDMARFIHYLSQDALYLKNYCEVLSSIASRIADKEYTEAFLRFALDGVEVERAMHSVFISRYGAAEECEASPACLLYMSYLGAQVSRPVEVQAAAVLPCFWIYLEVGRHIAASAAPGNPFAEWIATYSDPAFEQSTAKAIDICDALAARSSESVRKEMTEAFLTATRLEWMFWDSAYNLEKWKI